MLILQDQAGASGYLTEVLEKLGHQSLTSDSTADTFDALSKNAVDLIFIDTDDCARAVASLSQIKADNQTRDTPVVVATRLAGSDHIIETMQLGAVDHLNKPVAVDDLRPVLERALARPKATSADTPDAASLATGSGHLGRAMRELTKLIGLAAACEASVLIRGETGSGKDTVARAIHKHSRHKLSPLTVIDCTAVPEDYETFESLSPGARGTVILDEIGDLNTKQQALLMRALKEDGGERPRIVATTQYDLIKLVKEKLFREDLYFRLNVLPITLPPLRERGADVLVLAETFLEEASGERKIRLSSGAAKLMLDYNWPGNVRELQNLVYHLSAVVRSAVVEADDLPAHIRAVNQDSETIWTAGTDKGQENNVENPDASALDYYTAMNALEKSLLERALAEANGNRAEAARLLGINRQLLYAKLKTHGLMSTELS